MIVLSHKSDDEDGAFGTAGQRNGGWCEPCAARALITSEPEVRNPLGPHEEHSVSVRELMDSAEWRVSAI